MRSPQISLTASVGTVGDKCVHSPGEDKKIGALRYFDKYTC